MGRQAGMASERKRAVAAAAAATQQAIAMPVLGGRPPGPPDEVPEGWTLPPDASAVILLFDVIGRPLVSYRVNINEALAIAGMLITCVAQTDQIVTNLAGRIGFRDAFVNPEPTEELVQDQFIPTPEEIELLRQMREAPDSEAGE